MNERLHQGSQVPMPLSGVAQLGIGMEIALRRDMAIKFTDNTADKLSARQARALQNLLHYAARDEFAGTDQIIEYAVEVKQTNYRTAWVSIRPDVPSLPKYNALRVTIAIETWHVHIGKRGKLEAWSYPRSLEQFAGKEWCGIHIMLTELEKKRRAEKRAAKETK